ncbi:MAG: class I SAM-dependent rRNA methyltransferase [Gammaproteobacteria bacterium]|nr:class I SAM-dependent rRNA methyltransferase [Gammaproteobacteria bacterium]
MKKSSGLAPLVLKKREDKRLRAGHLWVYSNEIDTQKTPLSGFAAGEQVELQTSSGKAMGIAYVNSASLICARLVNRDISHPLNTSLLVHRIKIALSLRERIYEKPYYRLVYGEGDLLPGLVVDRFDDILVMQITTAGMEQVKLQIIEALEKVLKPQAIHIRNDSAIRQQEGLQQYTESHGEVPEYVDLWENDNPFRVSVMAGQKTGWFYDQRENRKRLFPYVKDCRVLDLCSYVGGWGIQSATRGASQVVAVDSSSAALDQLEENARINKVDDRVQTIQGDVFDVLKVLREEREHFDIVIVDPPAFIKRRKDYKAGAAAYQRINQMAMQVMSRDAILVSASCSYHMEIPALQRAVLQASRHVDRNLQLLERGRQGADHPVHPAIIETEYLKAIYCRVLPV